MKQPRGGDDARQARRARATRRRATPRARPPAALRLLLAAALLLPAACGKRRPPLPPVERVPQRTELLSGVQRGNQVILEWPAPRRNASDESVQSIRRIDVYRLAERIGDPQPITEEEFGARSTLIGSVPFDEIRRAAGQTLTYVDELQLAEPVRLRYAVRYANAANQRASFSNFLSIEPASKVSEPPVLGRAPALSQTAVTLSWQAPDTNVDGTRPANLLGYNVYRATRAQNEPAQTPLNARPVTATEYSDQTFGFGEEYVYVVRAVSLGTEGAPVESLNSNAVVVAPADTFAPAPPSSLTAAATAGAPARVSIFFAANPERDVAGYDLYRSTDPSLPKKDWAKLNRNPLERTTYVDEAVEPGVRYYYYATAVDAAGNTSPPSDVVSEIAP